MRCALFRSRRANLRFQPADGMQVLVRARVTLFEPRGDFQLIVEHMEAAGEGALRQQIEALKARLAAEGLFEVSTKKPLPAFPKRIGVLTSPSGAAIRDVLTVLRRRWPVAEVVIYPVPVQGVEAARDIRRMLERADSRRECDLLILTRGGGSLEDLMPFNDEGLVRAMHGCKTPLISAVGHEIDITLADFVADRRAPTPSAAAEIAAPDGREVAERFSFLRRRLHRTLLQQLRQRRILFGGIGSRLARLHPGRRLQQQQQRLDELNLRLERAVTRRVNDGRARLLALQLRLKGQSPKRRLARDSDKVHGLNARLGPALGRRLQRLGDRASSAARQLHAVSPLATLGRGYAIVRRPEDGRIITRAADASVGETLEALLAEGALLCRVESTRD